MSDSLGFFMNVMPWVILKGSSFCLFVCLFLDLSDCGKPGKPDNAIVIMGNHWAGEYVRYLCNPGYTMVGPAVRRCLPSGKWSGNVPTCKSSFLFCLKVFYLKQNLKSLSSSSSYPLS